MSASRNISAGAAALIVAGGIVVTVGYFVLQRSIQPRAGVTTVDGLGSAVEVSYDEWAIPTIVAANQLDLARAQGFIHASERLWQMELFQRIRQGRLAEIFGAPALATDRLIRTLDLTGASERALAQLDPADRRLLEAYAEGVNARVASWRGPLPPEFIILGVRPQPWNAAASLGIARIMALDLSGWRGELSRIATLARIPSALHEELAPGYPAWGPTIMQDSSVGPVGDAEDSVRSDGSVALEVRRSSAAPFRAPVEPPAVGWDPIEVLSAFGFRASNSWAVGGSRTADGHPLLANDMHLALRAPSTWFVNALHATAEDDHVAGLSIPGTPGVVVGFNRHLAWGFTNAMVDDGDFVVEGVNLDASMYRQGEEWRPFDTRIETIEVRGQTAIEHTVRSTSRGPVISDVLPSAGLTMTLLWTGLERPGAATAVLQMNRARTAGQFRGALASFSSPHQNVIFATTAGELGYRLAGSIPLREGADPASPISFETLPDGWPGFVSPGDMPSLARPTSDYLASANNLQARHLFGVVGIRYPLPFRARRIDDVVQTASGWTPSDMVGLQLDTRSLWAERLMPRVSAAALRIDRPDVVEAFANWDLRVSTQSREATWFYIWLYRLRELIASDELDGAGYFPDLALDRILDRGQSPWVE